jgi:hypothetical protein
MRCCSERELTFGSATDDGKIALAATPKPVALKDGGTPVL